jgi:glycosyltransferase involved in cell wall biosynthesis
MIGDKQGEIGRLVRQHRCGIAITPGDATTLADTLRRWSEEPQTVAEMGARARQMLEEKFTKAQAMARWSQLINQLAATSGSEQTVACPSY